MDNECIEVTVHFKKAETISDNNFPSQKLYIPRGWESFEDWAMFAWANPTILLENMQGKWIAINRDHISIVEET